MALSARFRVKPGMTIGEAPGSPSGITTTEESVKNQNKKRVYCYSPFNLL